MQGWLKSVSRYKVEETCLFLRWILEWHSKTAECCHALQQVGDKISWVCQFCPITGQRWQTDWPHMKSFSVHYIIIMIATWLFLLRLYGWSVALRIWQASSTIHNKVLLIMNAVVELNQIFGEKLYNYIRFICIVMLVCAHVC